MTDIAIGPDYDPAKEILTDASGRPITTGYVAQLAEEAEAGYELGQARTLTAADLTAMRTRGRPTPGTGQSRAVSVRMNPELLTELHAAAAAACHVPVSTLIREAAAQWLHRHAI